MFTYVCLQYQQITRKQMKSDISTVYILWNEQNDII